jgi:hypothetical protein
MKIGSQHRYVGGTTLPIEHVGLFYGTLWADCWVSLLCNSNTEADWLGIPRTGEGLYNVVE